MQPDFLNQKCEIEESIINSVNRKYYLVVYYPKYHCKLNYIEHFWYSAKKWARKNCQYIFKDIQRYIPRSLASISQKTILIYYHQCQQKIDLYYENLLYSFITWKAYTAHYKPTNKNEDW